MIWREAEENRGTAGQGVENEATQLLSFAEVWTRRSLIPWDRILVTVMHSNFLFLFTYYIRSRFGTITSGNHRHAIVRIFYEAWNFNSGNYLFTTDTK